jgi:DNA-binding beta-propeller fold protein YncE
MQRCLLTAVVAALVAASPAVAQAAPGGRILASLEDGHRVVALSLRGEELASGPTGVGPRGLAVRDGKLFVANRGTERAPGSSVTILDLQTLQPERTVFACEACAPNDLAFDADGGLWLTGQAHKALVLVPPPYEQIAASVLAAWGWPTEIEPLGPSGLLLGAVKGGADLALLDPATRQVTRLGAAVSPTRVVGRPGGDEVWAVLRPAGVLLRVTPAAVDRWDPEAAQVIMLSQALSLAFAHGGSALVAGTGEGRLLTFEPDSGERRGELQLDGVPILLAPSPDGRYVAVALHGGERIVVVDLDDPAEPVVATELAAGGTPADLLWLQD